MSVKIGRSAILGEYGYKFGRNESNEIVSAMMIQSDMGYGNQIAEWIGEKFEGPEDARVAAAEESYNNPYVTIQWLASKYHGNGYGTQMMAEAFQYAAGKDAGLFLKADLGAIDFYKGLEPTVQDDSVFVWTPSKVMELAKRSTREGFTGKSLTIREALADVRIGGEEIEDYEDLEPLDGAFVSPLDIKKTFPHPWRKKIEEEQGLGFISEDDMRVLGERDVLSKLPEGSFGMFSVAREELMRGVRKSLEGLVLNVMSMVGRHGEHQGQEGREGQAGGSKPGFTHTGGAGLKIPSKIVFDFSLTSEARFEGARDRILVGPKFIALPNKGREYVLLHEIGHSISDAMLKDGSAFDIQDAGAFMGDFDGRSVPGIQGASTPGENVAEAYAAFLASPDWLQKHYPAAYKAIGDAITRFEFPSTMDEALSPFQEQLEELKIEERTKDGQEQQETSKEQKSEKSKEPEKEKPVERHLKREGQT